MVGVCWWGYVVGVLMGVCDGGMWWGVWGYVGGGMWWGYVVGVWSKGRSACMGQDVLVFVTGSGYSITPKRSVCLVEAIMEFFMRGKQSVALRYYIIHRLGVGGWGGGGWGVCSGVEVEGN